MAHGTTKHFSIDKANREDELEYWAEEFGTHESRSRMHYPRRERHEVKTHLHTGPHQILPQDFQDFLD